MHVENMAAQKGRSEGDQNDHIENGSGLGQQHAQNTDNVCRDYLRNVCRRGAQCKFYHPAGAALGDLEFCHDFQNAECRRENCRFIHASRDDEEQYKKTGKLPAYVHVPRSDSDDTTPICKDYLKGECHRGRRCKFRHVEDAGSESPRHGIVVNGNGFPGNRNGPTGAVPPSAVPTSRYGPPPSKRRNVSRGGTGGGEYTSYAVNQQGGGGPPPPSMNHHPLEGHPGILSPLMNAPPLAMNHSMAPTATYPDLEQENVLLRQRVEHLRKQVTDLMSTNEFLLNQNAQLRLSKQSGAALMATTATIPATLTPLAAVSTPADLTAPSVGDVTTTVVPVSIAANLSGTPLSTPLSTTLATPLNTTLATPLSTTLAAPLTMAASQSAIITMSNSNSQLVSYPIMTQSLRPVIAHHMGP